MKKPHVNKTNPSAKILGDIMRICFLIGEETEYDAHFGWAAHVNSLSVRVFNKGSWSGQMQLEFNEYLNLGPDASGFHFSTDTYPKFKEFYDTLKAFYEANQ